MDDWQLIEDYAQRGSEAAFRTLVERHINLVRASAFRQVNDAQLADEVIQAVFVLLARKARSLPRGVVLAGWLFRTTRFVATRAVRGEQRRQRREQEAFEMRTLSAPDETWKRIAPTLDEALEHLPETERNAVLLRFYEDQNHQQVGAVQGLTEEAARKRVGRGLEKLRGFFVKRGFVLTTAGLASLLATNAATVAPAGLADSVAGTALNGGGAATAALPVLVRETLAAWRWAKVKLAGALATGVATLVGLGVAIAPLKPASASLEPKIAGLPSAAAGQPGDLPSSPMGMTPPATRPCERTLHLRVVAKDNDEVVANAQLAANTVAGGKWEQRFDLITDASGAADVPYPANAGRLDIGVLSWGWAARFATWRPNPEDPIPAEYTLRLDRVTNSMGGWLRDAQDRPIANAEVLVYFHSNGDVAHRETPRERPGVQGEAVIARSDLNGGWTCAAVPPKDHGGFRLRARHPEFRTTPIASSSVREEIEPAEAETLRLLWAGKLVTRMSAGPTLIGRVFDDADQPVPEARVVHSPGSDEALSATTDAGGYFSFPNLADDDFDFTVIAAGFAPEYRKITLNKGMESVEVRLKPGAQLRVRLVDEQGLPVPDVTLVLEQWGELRHKLSWSAQSDRDGRIEWNSAPSRVTLDLCAVRGGWCYTRDLRVQAAAEEHVIAMRREFGVRGRVTDADTGQPITELKAFPGYGEGEFAWERLDTRRSVNGNFTVQFSENKLPWRVCLEAEGYVPFVSEPLTPDIGGWLDVTMQRLRAVRGVVLLPDGQPAEGVTVTLRTKTVRNVVRRPDGQSAESATGGYVYRIGTTNTDHAGRFSFPPDPSAYSVHVSSEAGSTDAIVRNTNEPLTLRLLPLGHRRGGMATNDPSHAMLRFPPTEPDNEDRSTFEVPRLY